MAAKPLRGADRYEQDQEQIAVHHESVLIRHDVAARKPGVTECGNGQKKHYTGPSFTTKAHPA
ncbi:MAG: hypothetical protein ACYSUI_23655, partial [Planctomycetota bacterium]